MYTMYVCICINMHSTHVYIMKPQTFILDAIKLRLIILTALVETHQILYITAAH